MRAAVRSLTLNVYGIEDGAVQEFVCSLPASSYFTELAIGMTEQCQARARLRPRHALDRVSRSARSLRSCLVVTPAQKLDAALAASEEGDANAENAMESALAEVEDLISYCNDILCTGAAP